MKSRIYLIGNAGILIESQGKACLIDGLYDCSGTGFHASPIPESIYQDLDQKIQSPADRHIQFLLTQ
mgnify:CR=1 FL=1